MNTKAVMSWIAPSLARCVNGTSSVLSFGGFLVGWRPLKIRKRRRRLFGDSPQVFLWHKFCHGFGSNARNFEIISIVKLWLSVPSMATMQELACYPLETAVLAHFPLSCLLSMIETCSGYEYRIGALQSPPEKICEKWTREGEGGGSS